MQNRRLARISLLCVLSLFAAGSLNAQDQASARMFLNSIFRLYTKHGKGVSYNHRYLHSSLLKLIDIDAKLSGEDIPVAGDGDIVCGCQDWDGFFLRNMNVNVDRPGHAEALVSFSLFQDPNSQDRDLRNFRYILVAEGAQWRIFDVEYLTDPGTPTKPWSVREQIEMEIASLKHKTK